MRHNVVANFLFFLRRHIVVDVVDVRFHLVDLLVGDVDTQLLFGLGKRNPKFAPSAELEIGRENVLHLFACISLAKRRYVRVHTNLKQTKSAQFFFNRMVKKKYEHLRLLIYFLKLHYHRTRLLST